MTAEALVSPNASEQLVGRDQELELLRSFVDEAIGGLSRVLLLSGDPGIGKSVLLDAAARAAASAGVLVLRVDGVEFLADLSFAGLNHMLEPVLPECDGLDPGYRDALMAALGMGEGTAISRLAVYGAVLALLRRAARSRPVLMVVDDLQWVDRASAAALAFVARRLTGSRVGLLAASRPGFECFFERAGLPELAIPPLDEGAAAGLLGARFPLLGARDVQRILVQAGGNPLALLELPATLSDSRIGAGGALSEVLPLSRRLQELYASRIAELSEPTNRHSPIPCTASCPSRPGVRLPDPVDRPSRHRGEAPRYGPPRPVSHQRSRLTSRTALVPSLPGCTRNMALVVS